MVGHFCHWFSGRKAGYLNLLYGHKWLFPCWSFFLIARWVPQFVRTVETHEVTKCPRIAAASSEQRDVVGHDAWQNDLFDWHPCSGQQKDTTWKTAVAVNFHQLKTPKTSHSCLRLLYFPMFSREVAEKDRPTSVASSGSTRTTNSSVVSSAILVFAFHTVSRGSTIVLFEQPQIRREASVFSALWI